METHDLDGVHYQNENRRFYIPEKEASVDSNSYAYRWKSGELVGACSELTADEKVRLQEQLAADDSNLEKSGLSRNQTYAIDSIELEPAVLFILDSTEITREGSKLLSDSIERLKKYEKIFHIEVIGHTDQQGSVDYNQKLSQKRASLIKSNLQKTFADVNIHIQAFGEYRPIASNNTLRDQQLNRRVSLKAFVTKPIAATYDNTLCASPERNRETKLQDQATLKAMNQRLVASMLNPFSGRPPLSVGDRVRLVIPEGDEISGIYEISMGGGIEIPFLGTIVAHGRTTKELERLVASKLVTQEIFRINTIHVSATVQEWAPIQVYVSGATFDPGRVTVNQQKAEFRAFKQTQISGDFAQDRLLSKALLAAGGIRPDADLKRIQLIRNGDVKTVNMEGLFTGQHVTDTPLAAGDQVHVPSLGYFQGDLVKRTQVTPPGIRIFISNLTVPARNNSQAAIGSNATSVPYGTRLLRGMVSANCVGGTQLTNAARRVVLISTNPMTGKTEVVERAVQQLVSDPDRDEINPFLMPNDGIACYDSSVTNFRDVTKSLAEVLSPLVDLKILLD